ncbi:OLC1v1024474C1 [Oldenlandia corymbosa var. corymbosa]|uniref:OLC1v1024474C1 n=1 Tax=Oldenlandia corymbosa var. corymbosa TaxID=529605 RepID=A0AAV1C2N5_OLDCO|nr:OLC1v1024474C1 [Oldenlandia corymbosa var. corymbosa]
MNGDSTAGQYVPEKWLANKKQICVGTNYCDASQSGDGFQRIHDRDRQSRMFLLTDKEPTNSDGCYSQEVSLMSGGGGGEQVADDISCVLDGHDLQFERTVEQSTIYNDTHQLDVVCSTNPYTLSPEGMDTCQYHVDSSFRFGHVIVNRGGKGQLARYPSSVFNISRLVEVDDNRSQFHTSMVNIEEKFDGLNKDMEAFMRKFDSMVQYVSQVPMVEIAIESLCFDDSIDVNGFQEFVDLQSGYVKSTSSEEIDEEIGCRIVETSETKLSPIEDGLKDVDMIFNDHGHVRHSGPSDQVSGSSPLEHEEQYRLNSAGVDFATTCKMKLSSIEGSLRNVFQDQKNESFDDNRVRQSEFITDIGSDVPNLSHQEQGRLIMLDSDDTKDNSPKANEMSKGTISNGRPYGEPPHQLLFPYSLVGKIEAY